MNSLIKKTKIISLLLLIACGSADSEREPSRANTSRGEMKSHDAGVSEAEDAAASIDLSVVNDLSTATDMSRCIDVSTSDPSLCMKNKECFLHAGEVFNIDVQNMTCTKSPKVVFGACEWRGKNFSIPNGKGKFYRKLGDKIQVAEFNFALSDIVSEWQPCRPEISECDVFCKVGS